MLRKIMKLGKTKFEIMGKPAEWLVLFPQSKEEEDMMLEILKEGRVKGELKRMVNSQYYLTIEKDESCGK
jgi:hypothetical protein